MSPTRREVLLGLSGATLAYALQIGCAPGEEPPPGAGARPVRAEGDPRGKPDRPGIDARDWLVVSSDGSVTAYTNRTEIGQGLTTVMHDLIGQALDLPRERVNVVLGDTDLCPHDGPTSGSAATQYVGWQFWIACHQVKDDLVLLAAEALDRPAENLEYRAGTIVDSTDPTVQMGIGELADGRVRRIKVDPVTNSASLPPYVDRQTLNVNAEAIVTGTLEYAGDAHPDGCLYGAFIAPDYHPRVTKLELANIAAARTLPGVVRVKRIDKGVVALGETYTATRNAIRAMDANWAVPERPRELDREAEIRAGAELKYVVEEKGDVEWALGAGATVVKETYLTQYMSQVPLETDTAIASRDDGRLTVRLGTQNPFFMRYKVAQSEGIPESEIRIIAPPAGGAFGSKVGHTIAEEAASMLALTDRPVKYVYSRDDDVRKLGRYKEAVVFDVATAFDSYGRLIAREIDIYQDEGFGTEEMYEIPNVRTRLFSTRLPMAHATMRGTSYVQSIFALESHTDMAAQAVGMDPLELRRAHTQLEAFIPLIDWCAETFDYGSYDPPEGNAVGFAMCNHGGRQLAVVGAEVHVDRESGEVTVVRLAGAFDIGVLINRRLATNGVRGAMIWGLGAALFEEVDLDGHQCFTTGLTDYRIARMADTPPIEVEYFDNQEPGKPRGCGEVPVPPTIAAIANAVYNATGVRFYELPLTPERVKAALAPRSLDIP